MDNKPTTIAKNHAMCVRNCILPLPEPLRVEHQAEPFAVLGLQELFAAPHGEQDPLAALFLPQLVVNGLKSRKLGRVRRLSRSLPPGLEALADGGLE